MGYRKIVETGSYICYYKLLYNKKYITLILLSFNKLIRSNLIGVPSKSASDVKEIKKQCY